MLHLELELKRHHSRRVAGILFIFYVLFSSSNGNEMEEHFITNVCRHDRTSSLIISLAY